MYIVQYIYDKMVKQLLMFHCQYPQPAFYLSSVVLSFSFGQLMKKQYVLFGCHNIQNKKPNIIVQNKRRRGTEK